MADHRLPVACHLVVSTQPRRWGSSHTWRELEIDPGGAVVPLLRRSERDGRTNDDGTCCDADMRTARSLMLLSASDDACSLPTIAVWS
jgi:hypothetical protein